MFYWCNRDEHASQPWSGVISQHGLMPDACCHQDGFLKVLLADFFVSGWWACQLLKQGLAVIRSQIVEGICLPFPSFIVRRPDFVQFDHPHSCISYGCLSYSNQILLSCKAAQIGLPPSSQSFMNGLSTRWTRNRIFFHLRFGSSVGAFCAGDLFS